MEDDDPAQPRRDEAGGVSSCAVRRLQAEQATTETLDRQTRAMDAAPDHEGPVRAVPQAAEQHGGHEVAIGFDLAMPVTAERDV